MSTLRKILAEEGLVKKARDLGVATDAAYGGIGRGEFQVTISKGRESISATLEEWDRALDEARKDIRQAEWEY